METEKPIIDVDELIINQGNKEYKIQFIANESYNQNEMILKVFQNNSKENYYFSNKYNYTDFQNFSKIFSFYENTKQIIFFFKNSKI